MSWKTSDGNRRNMSANSIRAMDDALVPIQKTGMTSCFSLSRLEIIVCYNEASLLLYRLASFYSYLCVLCVCSCMCECVCACACLVRFGPYSFSMLFVETGALIESGALTRLADREAPASSSQGECGGGTKSKYYYICLFWHEFWRWTSGPHA